MVSYHLLTQFVLVWNILEVPVPVRVISINRVAPVSLPSAPMVGHLGYTAQELATSQVRFVRVRVHVFSLCVVSLHSIRQLISLSACRKAWPSTCRVRSWRR